MNSSRKILAVLCGDINRGKDVYGVYSLQYTEKGKPAWHHALTAWKFQELAIVKPPENNYDEITKYMKHAEEMFPKVSSLALPTVEQGFSLLKNYERIERQVRVQKVDASIRKTEAEIAQAQVFSSTYLLPGLLARLERQ